MSTELLIISDAADFGPALGVALARRGAWRVTIARDEGAALRAGPQGLVLLDSARGQAGPILARQLHEYGYDVPVLCSARGAGLEAALARLETAADSLADAPLEPLAGNESDAGNWRYVSEPDFLRLYGGGGATAPEGAGEPESGMVEADPAPQESSEGHCDTVADAGGDTPDGPQLADVALETGARFVLLELEREEVGRSGEVDAIAEAGLRALADGGPAHGPARLYLLEVGAEQEHCLLYVCNAGPLRLSILAPEDRPARELRLACERFLKA